MLGAIDDHKPCSAVTFQYFRQAILYDILIGSVMRFRKIVKNVGRYTVHMLKCEFKPIEKRGLRGSKAEYMYLPGETSN